MYKQIKFIISCVVIVCLCACASQGELAEQKNISKPLMENNLQLHELWSVAVGKNFENAALELRYAEDENGFYFSTQKGIVQAVSFDGKTRWRIQLKQDLVAGLAVDAHHIYCVSSQDELIALNKHTGEQVWNSALSQSVMVAPTSNNLVLVLHGVDGEIKGLDPHSGKLLWVYQDKAKGISIRGNSRPIFFADEWVVLGLDNGKMIALSSQQGELIWEVQVAASDDLRELDIDEDIQTLKHYLIAAANTGDVVVFNTQTGKIESGFNVPEGVRKLLVKEKFLVLADLQGSIKLFHHGKNVAPKEINNFIGGTILRLNATQDLLFINDNKERLMVVDALSAQVLDQRSAKFQIIAVRNNIILAYHSSGDYALYRYHLNSKQASSHATTAPSESDTEQ